MVIIAILSCPRLLCLALFRAATVYITKTQDGRNANIDAQTKEGDCTSGFFQECMMTGERTALMYAVQEGNYDVAIYLIEKGADRKLTDTQGKTACDYLHGLAPATSL